MPVDSWTLRLHITGASPRNVEAESSPALPDETEFVWFEGTQMPPEVEALQNALRSASPALLEMILGKKDGE